MDEKLKTVTFTRFGKSLTVSIHKERYQHGGSLVVDLFDEVNQEPYATVSVNVQGVELGPDEFVFKTYFPNDGLLEALLVAGVVTPTGRHCDIGPICRLL